MALHFHEGHDGAECVLRLTVDGGKCVLRVTAVEMATKTRVYDVLAKFKDRVRWRHSGRKSRKLCTGGLTQEDSGCSRGS